MYSAYMLFYQRKTAIASDQQQWTVSSQAQPPKVQVPRPIEDDISLKNEIFIREYCLFDPHHSAFVRQLHGASRRVNNGICSENHEQESRALDVFLAHLGRVVWRQQTTGIFEEALSHLRRSMLSCELCCSITLQWLARDEEVLHNLLLRCPHPSIRSQTRSFLVDCLKFLRDKDTYLYGTTTDSDVFLDADVEVGVIIPIAKQLATLAENSSKNTKGWDDLYLLLTQVAEMGHVEAAALLDTGILGFCLRLLCMHVRPKIADSYIDFHRTFQKRTGIYNRLTGFMFTMFLRMDTNLPVCDTSDRMAEIDNGQRLFPFTPEEKSLLLCWHGENKAYAVVDKMVEVFDQTKTECFYPGEVVKWMAGSVDSRVQRDIITMIIQGISELNNPYCDPYLRVASSYCEVATTLEALSKVCDTVVDAVAAIEQLSDEKIAPSGSDVLRFFQHVFRLTNPHLSAADIYWCLIARSGRYANALLLYSDESVRIGAHEFIRDLYTEYMEDTQNLDEAYRCARATVTEVIKRVAYESSAGMPRRHLEPLLATGKFLVALLYELDQSEDPDLTALKEDNDKALIYQWQIEAESRVRMLPEVSLPSPGEGAFDASDYGSESDDIELLDP